MPSSIYTPIDSPEPLPPYSRAEPSYMDESVSSVESDPTNPSDKKVDETCYNNLRVSEEDILQK